MAIDEFSSHRRWYEQERPAYGELASHVEGVIRQLINHYRLQVLSVSSRAKSVESFMRKLERKGYVNPKEEMTDLAGVRVIVYIESEVAKVIRLIESNFNIHAESSPDKSNELGIDQVGYRSVHQVCDLGSSRLQLDELVKYRGMLFEVQVRTILQHAWAEIEHDRNYKFSGRLPKHLMRRFYCLAGMLEVADREFDTIARAVDQYAEEVSRKTGAGELDFELNTTSLRSYLPNKLASLRKDGVNVVERINVSPAVVEELLDCGINTLRDVNKLLSEEFFKAFAAHYRSATLSGILRAAMMFYDLDLYFKKAWRHHWSALEKETVDLLCEKYSAAKVRQVFSDNGASPTTSFLPY